MTRQRVTQKVMPRIKDQLLAGLIIVLHCILHASRKLLVRSPAPGACAALFVTSRPLASSTCGALDPVNDLGQKGAMVEHTCAPWLLIPQMNDIISFVQLV